MYKNTDGAAKHIMEKCRLDENGQSLGAQYCHICGRTGKVYRQTAYDYPLCLDCAAEKLEDFVRAGICRADIDARFWILRILDKTDFKKLVKEVYV